jgi:uncharacterized caspase-like protein
MNIQLDNPEAKQMIDTCMVRVVKERTGTDCPVSEPAMLDFLCIKTASRGMKEPFVGSAPAIQPAMRPTDPSRVTAPVGPTTSAKVSSGRPRYALVIGNGAYSSQRLDNPVNDARDIAAALKRLTFDVTLELDTTHQRMEQAIRSFGTKLGKNTVGLFYYAGHAVQYEGENYLLPVDTLAAVSAPGHLKQKAVNVGYVLEAMEYAGNGLNIVILDACRDNPFRSFTRSLTRGLAQTPDANGVLIAFSTSPGKTAADGTGRNSPYTKQLLRYITVPTLTIEAMFKNVMREVKADTGGTQKPWYTTSMEYEFYFAE